MYILQMADLHINKNFCFDSFCHKFHLLLDSLEAKMLDEQVVVCILGDIIDRGDAGAFAMAQRVFDYIISEGYPIEILPGNHDIVDGGLEEFDAFISRYVPYSFSNHGVIVRPYEDADLILLNSVYHMDYSYGKICLKELDEISIANKCVCMMHHTILSENDGDSSSLRNAYHFLEAIENKDVVAVLHGHTHGYKDITVNHGCKVIGVGPFSNDVPNVNSQCNVVRVVSGVVDSVRNCRYNADLDCYTYIEGNTSAYDNYYHSDSISKAHQAVIKSLKVRHECMNLHICIETDFTSFKRDIYTHYKDYRDDAVDWLSPTPPASLYYNHGSYMTAGNVNGVDYVIEELKRKRTSSRAVIPLINFKNVIQSGSSFLPSFNNLQFGFGERDSEPGERIFYANLQMRDVEVNNFLYINIYELFILIEKILSEIGESASCRLKINIISFRARYKEKFGCFKKARLDSMTEAELTIAISGKRKSLLKEVISDKMKLHETIVQSDGFAHLRNAFAACWDADKDNHALLDAVSAAQDILEKLRKIEALRKVTNDTTEMEKNVLCFSWIIRTVLMRKKR